MGKGGIESRDQAHEGMKDKKYSLIMLVIIFIFSPFLFGGEGNNERERSSGNEKRSG